MADQLRLRGGDATASQLFIGADREVTVDTDLHTLRVHDGTTAGGHLLATLAQLELVFEQQNASFSASLTSESTVRDEAVAALQTAIADAIAARDAADSVTLANANTYTDTQIAALVGNSPELLNQLEELAAALNDDENFATTITNSVATLRSDLETALATETTARTAADTALSGRLDVLEADPITATTVAADISTAVTAESLSRTEAVNAEATARAAADSALSTRLDALEADDTTATAVAAVQSDVDANETASLAADAALSARLDLLEADPTTASAVTTGDAATLSSANSYTDTKISEITGGASEAFDTLKELQDALADGDSDVLTNLSNQVTTEATTRAAADTALSGRLDALEADSTTQTLLSAESSARAAADSALQTAIDAVQADVDGNESDADTAIAANTALITAEESARIAADLAETTARTAAISAESTARAAADAAEATTRANAITAEETARIAADDALSASLATTNTNLSATNTAYAAADTNLQTQIDSVNAVEAEMEARNLRAGLCFGQLYVSDLVVA